MRLAAGQTLVKKTKSITFDKAKTIYQIGFLYVWESVCSVHCGLYAVNVYFVWPFKKITYCSCQLTRTKMTGLPPISINNKNVVRLAGYT